MSDLNQYTSIRRGARQTNCITLVYIYAADLIFKDALWNIVIKINGKPLIQELQQLLVSKQYGLTINKRKIRMMISHKMYQKENIIIQKRS